MTTTWVISGQNGLTGTVTLATGSTVLHWHLVAPTGHPFPDTSTTKDLDYGGATALPYTYVDGNGLDQMAVIDGPIVYLDQEYSVVNMIMISSASITPTRGTTSAGGTTGLISLQTWKIQGENGLTGIVTLLPGVGLVWNLKPASGVTLPSTISSVPTTPLLPSGMSRAVPYGGPLTIPVTYIQSGGSYNNTDQMAVYQIGGFGSGIDYALDREYTGGDAETYATSADVTVVSATTGYTKKIHYPADIVATWAISGQNGLTGTVTLATGSTVLHWHLIAPTGHPFPDSSTTKDLDYGGATALPYTYVDGNGLDQMVVIDGSNTIFNQEYTIGTDTHILIVPTTSITPTRGTTSAGGTTGLISLQTWKIQGENGLTGIVTLLPGLGLYWNLKPASGVTLPSTISSVPTTPLLPSGMSNAVPYGGSLTTPVTYIQSGGSYNNTDQMAAYQIGGFGSGIDYALDRDYTGGSGETYATSAHVTVISDTTGYTKKIHYPADTAPALSILANPTSVTAGTATNVTFTVTSSGSPINGVTVNLSGVASGTGITNSSGIVIISVNATGEGTITATASNTGYTNGSTTITANAPSVPVLSVLANPTSVTAGTATNMTFTVTSSGSPINGATVNLSGVASGTSTTNSSGIATISVNATGAGTITATASKTSYASGSTTIIATAGACTVDISANKLSTLLGDKIILTVVTTPLTSTFSVDLYQNNGTIDTLIDTIVCNVACSTIWDTTGLVAGAYDIHAKIGTECSSSVKTVTLTTTSAEGSGSGMLIGLVGVAALGVMMTSKKP
jgi:hypothetical protein